MSEVLETVEQAVGFHQNANSLYLISTFVASPFPGERVG